MSSAAAKKDFSLKETKRYIEQMGTYMRILQPFPSNGLCDPSQLAASEMLCIKARRLWVAILRPLVPFLE
jgi:hypothetical protein